MILKVLPNNLVDFACAVPKTDTAPLESIKDPGIATAGRGADTVLLLQINPYDIISLKFVRHRAVTNTGNHGSEGAALLHEVFLADWVIETLSISNIAEFDSVTGWLSSHSDQRITLSNSTSKVRVALGGTAEPAPREP